MADALWPEADAVGRRFRVGGEGGAWLRVVGVVGELRRRQDGSAIPQFYRPLAQSPRAAMTLVAGVSGDPDAWSESVRAATWAVDPDQPVEAVVSLRAAEFQDMSVNWAIFGLFVLFAAFALVMAAAGIYGVVSYSVASRTPEFGIRLALGASPRAVRGLVLRQGIGVAVLGVVIGLGAAWMAAGLMGSMVVGVSPRDPLTFLAVPLVLLAVAVFANWAPAVRATRVDPVRALRDD
jgi:putative ABC transport system permease protein